MRVTVLGCGGSAGVPHIGGLDGRGDWGACDPAEPRNRRTRSSLCLEDGQGFRLLVDTGPDMREQLIACGVPGVDAILYTHGHADHVTGIDDVRILNRIAGRPISAYATKRTLDELIRRFDYAFKPWKPPGFYRPVMVPQPVAFGDRVQFGAMELNLFEQDHGVLETIGFRVGAFGYSTDVVRLDEAAFATLAGVDTWLVDCFQRQPHTTHAHFSRVIEWVARVGARRTILTHMGQDMDWAWMVANLPPGVEPAVDGMVLEF